MSKGNWSDWEKPFDFECATDHDDFTVEEKLNYGYGNNETNSIAIVWNIDDVRQGLKDSDLPEDFLDDGECMQVLGRAVDGMDEYGFTWESIYWALEEEFGEKISDYRNKQENNYETKK